MSGKARIIVAFCISMGLLLLLGAYAFKSTNQYKSASEWVTHTQTVISEAEVILREIQGIESSQRGYVITGEPRFIRRFNSDIATVRASSAKLKGLISDNPRQTALLDSISRKLDSKIKFAALAVETRDASGFAAAQKLIATGVGEDLMLDLKAQTEKFIANEEGLLNTRLEVANASYSFARNVIISVIIFTIIFVLVTMIFFIKDYNIRKRAADQLKMATRLAEESVMLKEAFLANMSHEIRTPMNAIIGFTDLLLKRELGASEKDYVSTIKTSGENLLRIINDILDVSKMESGMMSFETHPLSIKELFSSLKAMLGQKAGEKNISLAFSFDPAVPDVVLGDPTRLTQILINLVGNSIKFTSKGKIEVFAKTVGAQPSEEWLIEFTVKDTGIGIPKDKLDKVFERFIQAESHTTRHYGGTGLGLSIVKQLVELQGGTITIGSTLGEGSVVTFVLPFRKMKEGAFIADKSSRYKNGMELRQKKVLLVEDNPVNVKYMLSLLELHGIVPELAENGKIAVEKIKNKVYDVVLMDIEMPEMNGYEATTIIRKELKNSTPIIAMTAHAMAGEQEKCLQLGMNAYISKPVRESLLLEKLFDLPSAEEQKVTQNVPKQLLNLDFLIRSMRGRKEVIRETMEMTLRQLPEDMQMINEGFDKADMDTVRRFAHRMRSTVSLLGMAGLESLLGELEMLAMKENGEEQARKLHEPLSALYRQAIEEIETEKLKYH